MSYIGVSNQMQTAWPLGYLWFWAAKGDTYGEHSDQGKFPWGKQIPFRGRRSVKKDKNLAKRRGRRYIIRFSFPIAGLEMFFWRNDK